MKMREECGCWVDTNNNSWDSNLYTRKEAEALSATLINCKNCYNCYYCCDSQECYTSSGLYRCSNVIGCVCCYLSSFCVSSKNLINCSACYKCSDSVASSNIENEVNAENKRGNACVQDKMVEALKNSKKK